MFDPKLVFADNVEALMLDRYGKINKSQLAKDACTPIANVQRILDRNTSVGLNVVAKIAAAFDLLPWQMLFPDLDPKNPPVLCITAAERQLYSRFQIAAEQVAQYHFAAPENQAKTP